MFCGDRDKMVNLIKVNAANWPKRNTRLGTTRQQADPLAFVYEIKI